MEKFLKLHESMIVFPFFQDECDQVTSFTYVILFSYKWTLQLSRNHGL